MLKEMWYRIKNFRQKNAVILMYHQVCIKKSDPWDLAVDPEKFASQLHFLKRNFDVLSMEELVESKNLKRLKRNSLAITFDDGFEDNYTNAAPVLQWLKLPAAFYISTSVVDGHRQYWWDELQSIILHAEQLPSTLLLQLNGQTIRFKFRRDHTLCSNLKQEIKSWRASMPIQNERVKLYVGLWQHLKPLPYQQQKNALEEIKDWSKVNKIESSDPVMSVKQIHELGKNPLFTIGAHSVYHSMLASQSALDQAYEVKESKRIIQNWAGKMVDGFSYPYGNYTSETKSLLAEAGFKYAVSTESRVVNFSDDRFELPRIQVKNWGFPEFTGTIHKLMN